MTFSDLFLILLFSVIESFIFEHQILFRTDFLHVNSDHDPG